MPKGYLMPPLFRPRDYMWMGRPTGSLEEHKILGVKLNWSQIRRIASAISMEPVDDSDQAYDIVGYEVKCLGYEFCSLYDIDPHTRDKRPMMMLAVQDTIHPNRWGEEHEERACGALLWLRENGCKEACQWPSLEPAVIGLLRPFDPWPEA
ncbi:hypothetical protein CPB84DRAFT_1853634 [Gymnopilus junonius]|uniref:Uncharacterized protein n=1 Tax=Gymnopilus junonius TaxID=109634 RepID=A0A9P5TH49_GYMJU|nr:hypothetical protein CPB84DRAFT_1853634 [Gymnopilus junonius]